MVIESIINGDNVDAVELTGKHCKQRVGFTTGVCESALLTHDHYI